MKDDDDSFTWWLINAEPHDEEYFLIGEELALLKILSNHIRYYNHGHNIDYEIKKYLNEIY